MDAEIAAKYIAPFVKLQWPKDKEKLFNILSLVNGRAWKEGKWWGMTREFFVQVSNNNTIITPPGYDVLLKINLDTNPKPIRDQWFQFHRNGNGSIRECCGSNWCGDVHDLGPEPVLFQPFANSSCVCDNQPTPCVRLGIRSMGCEDEGAKVTITGWYPNEITHEKEEFDPINRVYTYIKTEAGGKTEICGCRKNDGTPAGKKARNGAIVMVDEDVSLLDIYWGKIESISKTKTRNPVQILAFYGDNKVKIIAQLEPWETEAKYRRYSLPDSCKIPCVHGMFKVTQPEQILDESQLMLISDREALLLLAKGLNMTYYEDDDQNGERFVLRGIKALDDQLKEQQSNADIPIQVSGPVFQSTEALGALEDY